MRCVRILLLACFVLPLIGCGGSPTTGTPVKPAAQAKPEPKPAQS